VFTVLSAARNRTARAVERTVPFQIACQAAAVTWYATAGHDPAARLLGLRCAVEDRERARPPADWWLVYAGGRF
jgi:hypothetical protein